MRIFCKTLFVAILFSNQIAMADDGYQLETTLSHDRYKSDFGYKSNDNNLDVTYYFSKIDPGNYPFEEAAFMSRSSSIGIGFEKGDSEYVFGASDNKSYSLRASYANPSHPFVVAGELKETKWNSPGISELGSKSFTISPSYFFRDNLSAGVTYTKYKAEYSGVETLGYDTTSLDIKWLNPLPSGQTYNLTVGVVRINIHTPFEDSSHATGLLLATEYYFTRAFNIGALVAISESGDSNETSYGLSSSWFITPRLFTKLSGIKNAESDNASLTLGMRF